MQVTVYYKVSGSEETNPVTYNNVNTVSATVGNLVITYKDSRGRVNRSIKSDKFVSVTINVTE